LVEDCFFRHTCQSGHTCVARPIVRSGASGGGGARGSAPHGQRPRACSSREWPAASTACHVPALPLRGRLSRFQHRVMVHAVVRRHSPDACGFSLAVRRQRARLWPEADRLRRLGRERRQGAAPPRHGRPVHAHSSRIALRQRSVPECRLLSLVFEQVFALSCVEVAVYFESIDQVRPEPRGARSQAHRPCTELGLCASPIGSWPLALFLLIFFFSARLLHTCPLIQYIQYTVRHLVCLESPVSSLLHTSHFTLHTWLLVLSSSLLHTSHFTLPTHRGLLPTCLSVRSLCRSHGTSL